MPDLYDSYFAVSYALLKKGEGGFFTPSRKTQRFARWFQLCLPACLLARQIGRSEEEVINFRAILAEDVSEEVMRMEDRYEIAHLLEFHAYARYGFLIFPSDDMAVWSLRLNIAQEKLERYVISMGHDVLGVHFQKHLRG